MKKLLRSGQVTAALLLSLCMITGCSNVSQTIVSTRSTYDFSDLEDGYSLTSDTDTGLQVISESADYKLLLNKAKLSFAVLNKKTNYIWYSDPSDDASNPTSGSNECKALFSIQLSKDGQIIEYNSYENAVKNENAAYRILDNGFEAIYTIGQADKITSADIPLAVEASRFKNDILSKLDSTDQKTLLKYYKLYSIKNLTDAEKAEILKAYPTVGDYDLYGISSETPNYIAEKVYSLLKKAGYTSQDLEADNEANKIVQETTTLIHFDMKFTCTLENNALVVSLDCSDLYNLENYPISSLSFMEYFGASPASFTDGYCVLPDGSGTLFDYSKNTSWLASVSLPIYGTNSAVGSDEINQKTEQASLPVFGVKRGSHAFLCMLEDGASIAAVNSSFAVDGSEYNKTYPSYTLSELKNVSGGFSNGYTTTEIYMYQDQPYNGKVTLRYQFLDGDTANYSGMANAYRDRLLQTDVLADRTETREDISFDLSLLGAVDTDGIYMGLFPYKKTESMTTFSQATEILERLKNAGISNIDLRYLGWMNGGVLQSAASDIHVLSALGGKSGLTKFLKLWKDSGVNIYMDTSFLNIKTNTVLGKDSLAVHTLGNTVLKTGSYDIVTGVLLSKTLNRILLRPSDIQEQAESFMDSADGYPLTGLSLGDLGSMLYSDFTDGEQVNRSEAETEVTAALEKLQSQYNLMISNANAYSVAYADKLVNMPLDDSDYKRASYEIPFLPMVLHGLVEYSGIPVNTSQDYQTLMLKAVEYGAVPSFLWCAQNETALKNSEYNQWFSIGIDNWFDTAVSYYTAVNQALSPVMNCRMISHEQLEDDVFKTDYENGTSILVNYKYESVTVNGTVINARSWLVVGGE